MVTKKTGIITGVMLMAKKYDVIIIGAGPSGIFCAYELIKEKKGP